MCVENKRFELTKSFVNFFDSSPSKIYKTFFLTVSNSIWKEQVFLGHGLGSSRHIFFWNPLWSRTSGPKFEPPSSTLTLGTRAPTFFDFLKKLEIWYPSDSKRFDIGVSTLDPYMWSIRSPNEPSLVTVKFFFGKNVCFSVFQIKIAKPVYPQIFMKLGENVL